MRINGKNTMYTAEEKEKILLEYYSSENGYHAITRKYNLHRSRLRAWKNKYEQYGVEGLKSNSGKKSGANKGRPKKPKSYQEELELKIMKLEIENERLKKGYLVKGDGAQKEYVTTLEEIMR